MGYINGNNIYGVRTINESPSRVYKYDSDEISMEKDCECNKGIEIKNNYDNDNSNNTCNKKPCDCDNDKKCDKKHDKWHCGKKDKCCEGDTCVFDPSKAKCICTYLDILFNEDSVNGSPLFNTLNTGDGTGYTIKVEYKSQDPHCCTPCIIDETSEFEIDSSRVTFKQFNYTGPLAINSVLIDGKAIVASEVNNGIVGEIPSDMFLDENCTKCDKGTIVSVLLNAISAWEFIAKIELCGKVTTGSTTCKFIASFTNDTDSPIPVSDPSTFLAQEVCLPPSEEPETIILNIDFDAISQLITPTLDAILSDPTDPTSPVVLSLTGNLMINPIANLQILKNTKVCFNAMI